MLIPLIMAPMDGLTDESFRLFVSENYGGWDFYFSEFLRIPSVGNLPKEAITKHLGTFSLEQQVLQIMVSANGNLDHSLASALKEIKGLQVPWIDLNLGCPSKTVTCHASGSFLLAKKNASKLAEILQFIRSNLPKPLKFSIKIRLGVEENDDFLHVLKLATENDIDLVTIHGRTAKQAYSGKADWQQIRRALEGFPNLPIAANGDINSLEDIKNIQELMPSASPLAGLMIGRGAIAAPWLASYYKQGKSQAEFENDRTANVSQFLLNFFNYLKNKSCPDKIILSRIKAHSHYLFDKNNPEQQSIKQQILRTQDVENLLALIFSI